MWTGLATWVMCLHALFIVFVAVGGLCLLRYPRLIWLHMPCVLWGILVEIMHWPCPLTPLEQWLRAKANMPKYSQDFISHHLQAFIYPEGLTHDMQVTLGILLLIVNLVIYAYVFAWKR